MAASAYNKDYYALLQLKRTASFDDIKTAFRRMALMYHPSKSPGTKAEFDEVAEAYTVLSDEKLRAIFDQFGEATLKQGAMDEKGQRLGGWKFSKDPNDIFNEFFGSSNPFSEYYKKGPKLGFDDGYKAPKKRSSNYCQPALLTRGTLQRMYKTMYCCPQSFNTGQKRRGYKRNRKNSGGRSRMERRDENHI
mmetsp:Transcript_20904/g.33855  ORF Transcript_20904/g.33855 Transcript_20904/m.33855 type:complete len:192 (-) Transcript_20904:535-1110(-)